MQNDELGRCGNGLQDNLLNQLLSKITGGASKTITETGSNVNSFIDNANGMMNAIKPVAIIAGTILGVKWIQEIILNDRQLRRKR